MFDDEDEKYEKYVDDYEYGDYDEQDMNRSYGTKRKKSGSWSWPSSGKSGSGHIYVQSRTLQDDGFEKCCPEWLIIVITIINAILLLLGIYVTLNFYFWLIVYALNFIMASFDFGLVKENYQVEEKDIVSHYKKEKAKKKKKMWRKNPIIQSKIMRQIQESQTIILDNAYN